MTTSRTSDVADLRRRYLDAWWHLEGDDHERELLALLRDLTEHFEQSHDDILWTAHAAIVKRRGDNAQRLPPGWDAEGGEPCCCGAVRGRWGSDGATWAETMFVPGAELPTAVFGTHRPARAGGCQ